MVWHYDGTQLDILTPGDRSKTRGADAKAHGIRGDLGELIQWLKRRSGVDLVLLKAFDVQPARP